MSNCGIKILKIPFGCDYIVQGNTISKTIFRLTDNPLGLDFTSDIVEICIKNGNKKLIDISSGDGITVVSATEFEIDEVPATENNFPYGKFIGDFDILLGGLEENRYTYSRIQYTVLKKEC